MSDLNAAAEKLDVSTEDFKAVPENTEAAATEAPSVVSGVAEQANDVESPATFAQAGDDESRNGNLDVTSAGTTDANFTAATHSEANAMDQAGEDTALPKSDGANIDTDLTEGVSGEASVEEITKASGSSEGFAMHGKTDGSAAADTVKGDDTKARQTASAPPQKPPKASFNIDAKPFSPLTLKDPSVQGTLVGEANGLSIKIGQWGAQPFVPKPNLSPTAPVGGSVPYTAVGGPQALPVKKEGTTGKDSLSAFAKPWSPHPEITVAPIPSPENEVAIHPGAWTTANVEGKDVQTPSPMVPKESNSNIFAHSFTIHPKGLRSVDLDVYNYVCPRCPLKTLYGRLSSRQPDVTMQNVVMDVPPLCVAHLLEQITKHKVTALCVSEAEDQHYDIWLEKPNMASAIVELMSECVWTCPMYHGYAVVGKNEEGKKYLRNYMERLKDSKPEGPNVYDVELLVVKEH